MQCEKSIGYGALQNFATLMQNFRTILADAAKQTASIYSPYG
jgi:hypothetical protein